MARRQMPPPVNPHTVELYPAVVPSGATYIKVMQPGGRLIGSLQDKGFTGFDGVYHEAWSAYAGGAEIARDLSEWEALEVLARYVTTADFHIHMALTG